MADIKVIKKTVAPASCWFTVEPPENESGSAVIKVELDRAYPYIWIASMHDSTSFGLALTYEDVQRAAIIDPDTDTVTGFDLHADGILSGFGFVARCITAGARKTFYVIPGFPYNIENLSEYGLSVSAQDNPVCPFASTTGCW